MKPCNMIMTNLNMSIGYQVLIRIFSPINMEYVSRFRWIVLLMKYTSNYVNMVIRM